MIRRLVLLCSVAGLSVMAPGAAGAAVPTIVAPSQLHWKPGTGPLKGAQVAQVFGDASKPGAFVTRIRFPDGHKVAPHYHPVQENVTVLQGTLMIGIGDTMDTSKMISLPAGSFVSIPRNVHHYGMAKGDTIIQLNDAGPWSMHPVSP